MRYVPNLIPEKSRVLPDYFKGEIYAAAVKNPIRDIVLWILGGFFFVGALVWLKHPLAGFVFALLGALLIPPGHRFIERNLRFRLTTKIKVIAVSALIAISLPITSYYSVIDKQLALQQKLQNEKIANEKAIAEKNEQVRKDSLYFHIQKSNQFRENHKIEEAFKQLQFARSFASGQVDEKIIEKEKIDLESIKAFDFVKAGKYKAALIELSSLLQSDPSNSELLYNRAFCFSKIGKIEEAVSDLRPLVQSGNKEAVKLNDRINPIKKRVAYYVTRCCDGSTSNAKGRGACSHHGGVCDWNEPVYEEYRKYE